MKINMKLHLTDTPDFYATDEDYIICPSFVREFLGGVPKHITLWLISEEKSNIFIKWLEEDSDSFYCYNKEGKGDRGIMLNSLYEKIGFPKDGVWRPISVYLQEGHV